MDMSEAEDFSGLIDLVTLPKEGYGYLYAVLNTNGVLLYIGRTVSSVASRVTFHSGKLWWKDARFIRAFQVPLGSLNDAESDAIHKLHPVANQSCPYPGCWAYRLIR